MLAAYRAGPKAIISLIRYLQDYYEGALGALQEKYVALVERMKRLEEQLCSESHNSCKPPSSDGMAHRSNPKRTKSKRKPGGQIGHDGAARKRVEHPEHAVMHRPVRCRGRAHPCDGRSSMCNHTDTGGGDRASLGDQMFPCLQEAVRAGGYLPEAERAVQYGPRLRAYAIMLSSGANKKRAASLTCQ